MIETPLGWARANMMYDTMRAPPRPGSLLEILFMMIQMRREAARLMEVRAIVQAVRDASDDGKSTQDAYDDFRRSLMPYLGVDEKERSAALRAALNREFQGGPMKITSLKPSNRVRSRLRKIVTELKQEPRATLGWRR
jgi:hypothetical protein